MKSDSHTEQVKLRLSQALADVTEKSEMGQFGIGWSLRTVDNFPIVPKELIGHFGSMEDRATFLDFADKNGERLCEKFCVDSHLLSRQSGSGGAIVASHFILSVYCVSEMTGETISLLAAIKLGWITKKQAIEMAKIFDGEHPKGNSFFLENDWGFSISFEEAVAQMPEDIMERIKWYFSVRFKMKDDDRLELFKQHLVPFFGEADEETKTFRKRCAELGHPNVFPSHGMTNEEVIRILEDPETQKIFLHPERHRF